MMTTIDALRELPRFGAFYVSCTSSEPAGVSDLVCAELGGMLACRFIERVRKNGLATEYYQMTQRGRDALEVRS